MEKRQSVRLRSVERGFRRLGMQVPRTGPTHRAEEVLLASTPSYLVAHSIRSFIWGALLAEIDRREFDEEILYAAALLHDIGLIAAFDTGKCFEEDGAQYAERTMLDSGMSEPRAAAVASAIRLHMVRSLPPHASTEAVLLWDSTGVDVTGHRYREIPEDVAQTVLQEFPRLDFKTSFSSQFLVQAKKKPDCRVAVMVAAGFVDRISHAPFDE
jgi:hypothetical protein